MLGGSFNPVHIGHLVLAEEVRLRLGYDRVLFVPANIPPHKELAEGASAKDRLRMLELAAEGNPFFRVDGCELERGGVSYTFDTLADIGRRLGSSLEGKIGLVIGDDLVDGFEKWHRYRELPAVSDIVLARRVARAPQDAPAFGYRHTELLNAVLPVSSSEIRRNIASRPRHGGWRYLVPDSVYRYIKQRRLYGCEAD